MKIKELYQDFSVIIADEDHRHYRLGWANVVCPHCTGNPGFHLGYNLDEDYFYCWRCGFHDTIFTLSKLLKVTKSQAEQLVREYGGKSKTKTTKEPTVRIKKHHFKLPTGIEPLLPRHRNYILNRGFDPDEIERQWGVMSTGVVSQLDNIDYKHRLFIPVRWDDELVTFQTRDVTNKHIHKYINCPKEREIKHLKSILYGKQAEWQDTGICVEGVTDVWRFGTLSFATFGIQYTQTQLRLMSKLFKRIFVVFDDDPQAVKQAKKLVGDLKFRGVEARQINIKNDPGSMSQEEADRFISLIIK